MPMPYPYRHADAEWRAFLADARERMDLVSDNMAYNAIDGVFRAFRRRLTGPQGIGFASVLPAVPRAIFVFEWAVDAAPVPFASREEMTREAQALRPHHNLTPGNCIEAVAYALHRAVLPAPLARALAACPQGSTEFWRTDADPSDLGPRFG